MKVWKMFFLFTGVILRFHVSFPGSKIYNTLGTQVSTDKKFGVFWGIRERSNPICDGRNPDTWMFQEVRING